MEWKVSKILADETTVIIFAHRLSAKLVRWHYFLHGARRRVATHRVIYRRLVDLIMWYSLKVSKWFTMIRPLVNYLAGNVSCEGIVTFTTGSDSWL